MTDDRRITGGFDAQKLLPCKGELSSEAGVRGGGESSWWLYNLTKTADRIPLTEAEVSSRKAKCRMRPASSISRPAYAPDP